MITHQYGLLAAPPRLVTTSSEEDTLRERERLRRELLRRIKDREIRRQSLRGLRR